MTQETTRRNYAVASRAQWLTAGSSLSGGVSPKPTLADRGLPSFAGAVLREDDGQAS